jgi:MFS family permease
VGLIYLAMGVTRTIGRLVAGFVIDHFGCRKVLYIPPLGRAAAFFALAFCVHVRAPIWIMVILLCVTDFLSAFFAAASDTYTADCTPPADRPRVYSFLRVGLNLGWMIGPAIGAFLARTPFSLLFALTGACILMLSPLTFFLCPETRPRETRADEARGGRVRSFLAINQVFRNRLFLAHCAFSACHFLLAAQLVSTLSVYATNTLGITRVQLGWTYTINGLLVILFQLPINRLLAGASLGRRLAGGTFLYACGYLSIGFMHDWACLMVSILVISFAEMVTAPAVVAMVSELAPSRLLGRFMGVYGLAQSTGQSLGQFYGGFMYDMLAGLRAALWASVAVYGLIASVGFRALARRRI